MRLNGKGLLTILAGHRKRNRLEPGGEVVKVGQSRGDPAVQRLRGTATAAMRTDEIMKLLRSD